MIDALPKIVYPLFSLKLPSNGEEIGYRPFATKEEKILLLAMASENPQDHQKAIKQVVSNCITSWTKSYKRVEDLPVFDLEFIFLHLRIKSVGEEVSVFFNGLDDSSCEECKKIREVSVDLTEVKMANPIKKSDMKIMLTDSVGVIMKFLTVEDIESSDLSQIDEIDYVFELTSKYIHSIFDEEKVIKLDETSRPQIKQWIEDLPKDCFQKIQDFIEKEPTIAHTIEISCDKCKNKQYYTFRGLDSFFV